MRSNFLSILALAAIMPGVCFGRPRAVPKPNPASICATLAIQNPPPADNDPFLGATINGFVFIDLALPPPDSTAIYNTDTPITLLGLRFDPRGLLIRLPQKSFYAVVELGVFATDVVVEGFDSGGTILLFSVTVPPTGTSTTMVTVSGPNLATIKLTGGNNEGTVYSICAWGGD